MAISWTELTDLAADQWGLFTTAQSTRLGIDRTTVAHAARAGRFERLAHGVYAVAGTREEHITHLRAAYLAAEPEMFLYERQLQLPRSGLVSHDSAAMVYGYGNLRAHTHHLTFPDRKQTRRTDIRYHRAEIKPEDVAMHDGLPLTTVERTAADLVVAGLDEDHVADFLRDADRAGRVRQDALDSALEDAKLVRPREAADLAAQYLLLRDASGRTPLTVGDLGPLLAASLDEATKAAVSEAAQKALAPLREMVWQATDPIRGSGLLPSVSTGLDKGAAVALAAKLAETMPKPELENLIGELRRRLDALRESTDPSEESSDG